MARLLETETSGASRKGGKTSSLWKIWKFPPHRHTACAQVGEGGPLWEWTRSALLRRVSARRVPAQSDDEPVLEWSATDEAGTPFRVVVLDRAQLAQQQQRARALVLALPPVSRAYAQAAASKSANRVRCDAVLCVVERADTAAGANAAHALDTALAALASDAPLALALIGGDATAAAELARGRVAVAASTRGVSRL